MLAKRHIMGDLKFTQNRVLTAGLLSCVTVISRPCIECIHILYTIFGQTDIYINGLRMAVAVTRRTNYVNDAKSQPHRAKLYM
jgi:hypothetical protein